LITEDFGGGQCGIQGRGDVTTNLSFTICVNNRQYVIPACKMSLPEVVFDAINKGEATVVPTLEPFEKKLESRTPNPEPKTSMKVGEKSALRSPPSPTPPKTKLGSRPGTSGRQKFYRNFNQDGVPMYELVNWADIVKLAADKLGASKCKLSNIYEWTQENIVVKDRKTDSYQAITVLTNWEASIRQNRKHLRKSEVAITNSDEIVNTVPEASKVPMENGDPLSFLDKDAVNAELLEFGTDSAGKFDINEFLSIIGPSSPMPDFIEDVNKQLKESIKQNKNRLGVSQAFNRYRKIE